MIRRARGNLLDAKTDALVNTVNTVGIMGKGVALQFKRAYPENYRAYQKACKAGRVQPGAMFIHDLGALQSPRYIINFPTKKHWRARSRIEDIESGLRALVEDVQRLGIQSLALPPLGCGHGGLDWNEVAPLIEQAFATLPVHVLMFEPTGAPAAEEVVNRSERPKMTVSRAVILALMNRYLVPDYDYLLSLLEVFKLAYFMQEAGEPLRLDFQEGVYGPYADNLRHVLDHMESHYIRGRGDGKNEPDAPIQLLPGSAAEAEQFLENHSVTQECFARVAALIEGFETPFGMELLSSVHWVAMHKDSLARADVNAAIAGVHGWNARKKRLFNREYIRAAWRRLRDQEWL